jgi:hypothetical protein
MTNSSYEDDLQEELLDSYKVEQTLKNLAIVTGHKTYPTYKEIVDRNYNINALSAAKLVSIMIKEVSDVISYTPAVLRPTIKGEELRHSMIDAVQVLHTLNQCLITAHLDDEGWDDIKVIDAEKKRTNALKQFDKERPPTKFQKDSNEESDES